MYNKDVIQFTKMKSGNIGIESPYVGEFKDQLKRLVPSARWQDPYWIISPSGMEKAKELLAKYFPPQESLQRVRISWTLNHTGPQIDGTSLASISRDWWGWRKNCHIDFVVIEEDLKSGGSRKYPGLYGSLVIEAEIRPDATIKPEPDKLEVIEEGEIPNPLAGFSTEELLAELAKRGYDCKSGIRWERNQRKR